MHPLRTIRQTCQDIICSGLSVTLTSINKGQLPRLTVSKEKMNQKIITIRTMSLLSICLSKCSGTNTEVHYREAIRFVFIFLLFGL